MVWWCNSLGFSSISVTVVKLFTHIPLSQRNIICCWEDNHRSDVALAILHCLSSVPIYGVKAEKKEFSTPMLLRCILHPLSSEPRLPTYILINNHFMGGYYVSEFFTAEMSLQSSNQQC